MVVQQLALWSVYYNLFTSGIAAPRIIRHIYNDSINVFMPYRHLNSAVGNMKWKLVGPTTTVCSAHQILFYQKAPFVYWVKVFSVHNTAIQLLTRVEFNSLLWLTSCAAQERIYLNVVSWHRILPARRWSVGTLTWQTGGMDSSKLA